MYAGFGAEKSWFLACQVNISQILYCADKKSALSCDFWFLPVIRRSKHQLSVPTLTKRLEKYG
jgi:hypothetical protein